MRCAALVCLTGASELNMPSDMSEYWFVLDGVRVVFYSGVLTYMVSTKPSRRANYLYASFHLIIYSVSLVADAAEQASVHGKLWALYVMRVLVLGDGRGKAR